ncbi:MAG TPA: sigma-70 family RNA polymerase sigma factor [Candidatus Acidoferrum sp.]|nr:sigma-70 family RNA polymerase sigma factor [Candidatus Acidoferrum sp.]
MTVKITGRTAAHWNESDAIARAQQGDGAAFESLYNAHCKHVYSLCLRMLRNIAEAEDLTQQVFLQLFRKIGTFRGDSSFSTWLHRISVNAVLMHLRRRPLAEKQMQSLDDDGTGGTEQVDADRADTSSRGVIDSINLKRAIRRLPDGYKRFFLMHDVMGYRHAEIAALLGCSTGCSKSQLHKARKSLRRMLQGEIAGENASQPVPDSQSHQSQTANRAGRTSGKSRRLFPTWPDLHDSELTTC